MDLNNPKFRRMLWLYPMRAAAIVVLSFLLSSLTKLRIYSIYTAADSLFYHFPPQFMNAVASFSLLFIYNSILRVFTIFDRYAFRDFQQTDTAHEGFLKEFLKLIRTRSWQLEGSAILILFFLASLIGAFGEVWRSFYGELEVGTRARFFVSLVLLPLVFLINILAHLNIRRYWRTLKQRREEDKVYSVSRIVLRALAIVLLYPLAFPYVPLIFFALFNIVSVFSALFDAYGAFIVLGGIFFVIIPAVVLIKHLRIRGRKRKFRKRLVAVAEGSGYKIEYPKKVLEGTAHFTLDDGKKRFSGYLITPHSKRRILAFTSQSTAYVLYRIGTKKRGISLQHRFSFDFDATGDRLLVVMPMPKLVYAEEDGKQRMIASADKIWGSVVYDTEALIGAVDRKILGRYNGMFE